jgi:antitoxin component YwqK of YwqJK toxin-antitoxin module
MKKLLLLLLCVPLMFSCSEEIKDTNKIIDDSTKDNELVAYDDLNNKGTLESPNMYYKGNLFSGKASLTQGSPLIPDNRTAVFTFKYGMMNGISKRFYLNGQLEIEVFFRNNKRIYNDGVHKEYYENGQISYLENYKDGKLNGLQKAWHKNGQLACEGNYIDELDLFLKRDDNWKCWDEEGNEIECE